MLMQARDYFRAYRARKKDEKQIDDVPPRSARESSGGGGGAPRKRTSYDSDSAYVAEPWRGNGGSGFPPGMFPAGSDINSLTAFDHSRRQSGAVDTSGMPILPLLQDIPLMRSSSISGLGGMPNLDLGRLSGLGSASPCGTGGPRTSLLSLGGNSDWASALMGSGLDVSGLQGGAQPQLAMAAPGERPAGNGGGRAASAPPAATAEDDGDEAADDEGDGDVSASDDASTQSLGSMRTALQRQQTTCEARGGAGQAARMGGSGGGAPAASAPAASAPLPSTSPLDGGRRASHDGVPASDDGVHASDDGGRALHDGVRASQYRGRASNDGGRVSREGRGASHDGRRSSHGVGHADGSGGALAADHLAALGEGMGAAGLMGMMMHDFDNTQPTLAATHALLSTMQLQQQQLLMVMMQLQAAVQAHTRELESCGGSAVDPAAFAAATASLAQQAGALQQLQANTLPIVSAMLPSMAAHAGFSGSAEMESYGPDSRPGDAALLHCGFQQQPQHHRQHQQQQQHHMGLPAVGPLSASPPHSGGRRSSRGVQPQPGADPHHPHMPVVAGLNLGLGEGGKDEGRSSVREMAAVAGQPARRNGGAGPVGPSRPSAGVLDLSSAVMQQQARVKQAAVVARGSSGDDMMAPPPRDGSSQRIGRSGGGGGAPAGLDLAPHLAAQLTPQATGVLQNLQAQLAAQLQEAHAASMASVEDSAAPPPLTNSHANDELAMAEVRLAGPPPKRPRRSGEPSASAAAAAAVEAAAQREHTGGPRRSSCTLLDLAAAAEALETAR